ncbi:MAG: phosphatase PAP2 family protein [Cytophagaceae bacterium]
MIRIVKENKAFFLCMGLYVLAGFFVILWVPKGNLEREINSYSTVEADNFFRFYTEFGNGAFLMLVIALLFMRNMYYGTLGLISFLSSTIIVQLIKNVAFPEAPRPISFFEPTLKLHYVSSVEIHHWASFPSGHTSGAFTVFCLLALLVRNQFLAILFFSLALLVAFSRMYLLQHFFLDTYVGAIIGTATTMVCYYYFQNRTGLPQLERWNRPVFDLFKTSK